MLGGYCPQVRTLSDTERELLRPSMYSGPFNRRVNIGDMVSLQSSGAEGGGRTFYLQPSLRLLTFVLRMISLAIRSVGSRSRGGLFFSLCFPFVWLEQKKKPNLNPGDTT